MVRRWPDDGPAIRLPAPTGWPGSRISIGMGTKIRQHAFQRCSGSGFLRGVVCRGVPVKGAPSAAVRMGTEAAGCLKARPDGSRPGFAYESLSDHRLARPQGQSHSGVWCDLHALRVLRPRFLRRHGRAIGRAPDGARRRGAAAPSRAGAAARPAAVYHTNIPVMRLAAPSRASLEDAMRHRDSSPSRESEVQLWRGLRTRNLPSPTDDSGLPRPAWGDKASPTIRTPLETGGHHLRRNGLGGEYIKNLICVFEATRAVLLECR